MIPREKIPQPLLDCEQWLVWDTDQKLPKQITGDMASVTDPTTWTTFDLAVERYNAGDLRGVGFVFTADDPYCGVDLDGCRDAETGEVAEWAREVVVMLDSYSEVSPSGTGIKVFIVGQLPTETGRKFKLPDMPRFGDKEPAIEIYDRKRYFAVTGQRLAGVSFDIEDRQPELNSLVERFAPKPVTRSVRLNAAPSILERARKYMSKLPPAVSGSGGHNATFRAACILVLGFGLDEGDALALLREYNRDCKPAWSERELLHKIQSAQQQPGPRNYLRDARVEDWGSVAIPQYEERRAVASPVRKTTLQAATDVCIERIQVGKGKVIPLGFPDVDEAMGGGVEEGEMVIIAARPSHGKSAVSLQIAHHMTAAGYPSLIVSEEMSARAIGQRAMQYASEVAQEHWDYSTIELKKQMDEHFRGRADCFIVESCGSAQRAADTIREHVAEHKIKVAIVDYAQLLTSPGKSRYEQITNTSITLRQVASECNIVLVVLCQLNRQVEQRKKFIPVLGDIKDSGQLEQDADVVIFLVWPHRIDHNADPKVYQFFLAKNRNRAIHKSLVECIFHPSRQTFLPKRQEAKDMPTYNDSFDHWNNS